MAVLTGQAKIDFDEYLINRFGYSDYYMILEKLKLEFFDQFLEMDGEIKITSIGKLRELEEKEKIVRQNKLYCDFYNENIDLIKEY